MKNFNSPLINKINLKEMGWLAVFIDGEGYIGITFQREQETRQQSASARYHPYIYRKLLILNKRGI